MLSLEQKTQVVVQLQDAILRNESNEIKELLKNINVEDQICILVSRRNIFAESLLFLAGALAEDHTILALFHHLPQSSYVEVLKIVEDDHTFLTQAIAWGRTQVVQTLLTQVNEKTYHNLLNLTDQQGSSLKLLLSEEESELGNANLLEDIKKISAEKSSSVVSMISYCGLYAIRPTDVEKQAELIAVTSSQQMK